jgi:hypothetical protein
MNWAKLASFRCEVSWLFALSKRRNYFVYYDAVVGSGRQC